MKGGNNITMAQLENQVIEVTDGGGNVVFRLTAVDGEVLLQTAMDGKKVLEFRVDSEGHLKSNCPNCGGGHMGR